MAQVRNKKTLRAATRRTPATRPARRGRGGRWTQLFSEGNAKMRDLLGGKGAGLAEMSRIGLPVPPGLLDEVRQRVRAVEARTGKRFGDPANPLLVSVRSGAKFSMPGMMDTVLNLGLNQATVEGLAQRTGDARFAYDSYRRFMQMFGDVVLGVKHEEFETTLAAAKRQRGVTLDTELSAADLKALTESYRRIVRQQAKQAFPEDPWQQLEMAISAIFESWNTPRPIMERIFNKIAHGFETAVNIQTMVFGNMGKTSGTGVAFTRNPATGEKKVYGEYLLNAQGEDVVAGIRTPLPISQLARDLPQVYREFADVCALLEKH